MHYRKYIIYTYPAVHCIHIRISQYNVQVSLFEIIDQTLDDEKVEDKLSDISKYLQKR